MSNETIPCPYCDNGPKQCVCESAEPETVKQESGKHVAEKEIIRLFLGLSSNPYGANEEEFERARKIALDTVASLHKVSGDNLKVTLTAVHFVHDSLFNELLKT